MAGLGGLAGLGSLAGGGSMKPTNIFIGLLCLIFLVSSVSAVTWTASGSCWTATNGANTLMMWNATGTNYVQIPAGVTSIWILAIAGGGGASSGGGSAGGLINQTFAVVPGQTYTATVGAKGTGAVASSASATQGGNTTFGNATITLTAVGGGFGPKQDTAGTNGGSGSGAGGSGTGVRSGGTATSGQGNNGGSNGIQTTPYPAGGGGGAGGAGTAGSAAAIAAGGIGISNNITGT